VFFVCVFCVHESRLEQEFGIWFNLKYFEEKIFVGDWDECEKYMALQFFFVIINIRLICSLRLGSRSILKPWTGNSLHLYHHHSEIIIYHKHFKLQPQSG